MYKVLGKLGSFDRIPFLEPQPKEEPRVKPEKKKKVYPRNPYLVAFDADLQKQIKEHRVIDLTIQLWKQHCKKEIDLSNPFCFGRDREIVHIYIQLSTVAKPSNVIVTGPTGTGKTILIYELARQMLTGHNPSFRGQHILLMIPAENPANFSYHAYSRENMQFLAEKIGKRAILVFDECHQNLTSNNPYFNLSNISNLFSFDPFVDQCKTVLADNKLSILGLTDRLGNFLEKDPARERRFTVIELEELSVEGTIEVIQKKRFAEKHSEVEGRTITIEKETLRTGTYLSIAYFEKLFLPAKAYLFLDPAVSWYLKSNPKATSVPDTAIIDYMEKVLGKKREEVKEKLEQFEDLDRSQIPLQEPLAKYSQNLTSKARRGKLAPAWGREALIQTLATIFAQEEYNNVLLTSPPGCGKSRIAEALAYVINKGYLPALQNKEVLLLNWQLAQKDLPGLLRSARKYLGKFILVIDEAHRLGQNTFGMDIDSFEVQQLGSLISNPAGVISDMLQKGLSGLNMPGGGGSGLNELKEAMGRGELPALLLSTDKEVAPLIKDEAFMRRLKHIKLEPLSKEQIELILKHEMPVMSRRYSQDFSLSDSAAEGIYYLSEIYHKAEYQPSAAFKMLHCVCGYARGNQQTKLTKEIVCAAIADREFKNAKEVAEQWRLEKISDHPSSRMIPDDEPLKRFSDDWTKKHRIKKFPEFVGHEKAFESMLDALSRATCNNVLLIGKTGIGKTTLVERLAGYMAQKNESNIRKALRNKPLLALRLKALRADRKAFADFVESAMRYEGKYVLFIDEIHLLFNKKLSAGFGILPQFSDEMEELKPLLAEGKIRLIGAMTENDFKGIVFDTAMQRRFQIIQVKPPSQRETLRMLTATQKEVEFKVSESLHQSVFFSEGCLEQAVKLADPELLPSSAITVLEKAAVQTQNRVTEVQEENTEIHVQPGDLRKEEKSDLELNLNNDVDLNINDAFRLVRLLSGQPSTSKKSEGPGILSSLFWGLFSVITWPFRIVGRFGIWLLSG